MARIAATATTAIFVALAPMAASTGRGMITGVVIIRATVSITGAAAMAATGIATIGDTNIAAATASAPVGRMTRAAPMAISRAIATIAAFMAVGITASALAIACPIATSPAIAAQGIAALVIGTTIARSGIVPHRVAA